MKHTRKAPPSRTYARFAWFFVCIVAFVPMLLLVGCGYGNGGGGSGSTDATTGTVVHPTEPDQLVIQATQEGGFVPVEVNLTQMPYISLFGDGRVVVLGPMIEIYPQPAMPNLQTTVIDEDSIQKALEAARAAGLMQNGYDYGQPNVADLPVTKIAVMAENQTFTSSIYALGFETEAAGLTAEQVTARQKVQDFLSKLTDPAAFTGSEVQWEPFEFSALGVFAAPANPDQVGDSGVQPNKLDWPLSDLASAGTAVHESIRKLVVSGDDLTSLEPLLDQATQITLWKSGDSWFNLWFRPLLPNETATWAAPQTGST